MQPHSVNSITFLLYRPTIGEVNNQRGMITAKLYNIMIKLLYRHGGAVGSALDSESRIRGSRPGRANCVEALSPHRVTAVGKLLTLNCLGGDWPSFTFILTVLSSDCGLSVDSNKRILLLLLLLLLRICFVCLILRPCQHDNGYMDGRSQI